MKPLKRAAVVVIGNELLSGKFQDENGPFLIKELRSLGVELARIELIQDGLDTIAEAVSRLKTCHDWVFTTGGVGPTHDDLTMAGVAAAFDIPVVMHPELERMLRHYYADACNEHTLRMARIPQGATLIRSGHPSWPVIAIENVYVFPGVPKLFQSKFRSISARFQGSPFHTSQVFVDGEENIVAPLLERLAASTPEIIIGSYPRFDEVEYKVLVTIECRSQSAVANATKALLAMLKDESLRVVRHVAPQ